MKKAVLALALAGVCTGQAHAQSAVHLYGNVDIGTVERSDQSLAIGKRANNTLGVKGIGELGEGLKAVFQLEIRYEPDVGTLEQDGGGVQRPLFQGESRVGLQGGFGLVRLGRGLTAFQETSIAFEPFHGIPSPAGFQTDLAMAGYTSDPLGRAGNAANRFSNALFYNSPELNGFQLNTTLATRESNQGAAIVGTGSALAPQYPAGAEASAHPYSISATYRNGPAAMMLAAERNAVESRLLSVGAYVMTTPELKLMATYTRHDQSHTRPVNPDTSAWVLGANYTMGPGKFLAGYGQMTPDGVSTTKQLSLGYEYSLSRRTYLYFDLSNKKGPADPSSVNHYAVGVNHAF